MQYRNLNLDKLQAFAPERKLIDKENIYNAFLGLGDVLQKGGDALQKGVDAYKLNKIYQLSPEEQQRKMAEYRAHKGDFSGFDNMETTKLRQAEINALKEQQRQDKEDENAILQRDKELSYNALIREYDALTSELLKNMREFNKANSDLTYRDINNKDVQLRFLKEQDTGLLQKMLTNLTEKEKLGYEPKNVNATIEDVFGLKHKEEQSKGAEPKGAEPKGEEPKGAEPKEEIIVDDFSFDTSEQIQNYLENENYKTNQGLTDDRKEKIKKYITKKYKLYNGSKVIKDGLSDDEISKIEYVGFGTITNAEVNILKKEANEKVKYNTIATDLVQASFGDKRTNESDKAYIKRMYNDWKASKIYYPQLENIINRVDKNLIKQLKNNNQQEK